MLIYFPALLIYYDGLKIPQRTLIDRLVKLESKLGDLSDSKVPSRLFKLPIIFNHPKEDAALQRYMETQRPYASYLPNNMDFVAKNNGLSTQELKDIYTKSSLIAVSVGFFAALPLCLPIDPRQRINCPKVIPLCLPVPISMYSLCSRNVINTRPDEPFPCLHTRGSSLLGRLLHGSL